MEAIAKEATATFPYVLIQSRRLLGNGSVIGWVGWIFVREAKSGALDVVAVLFFLKLCSAAWSNVFLRNCQRSVGEDFERGGDTDKFLEKRIDAK